jgi:hypothetical protein
VCSSRGARQELRQEAEAGHARALRATEEVQTEARLMQVGGWVRW